LLAALLRQRWPFEGGVYFVWDGSDCKIGMASVISKRIQGIERAHPRPIAFVRHWPNQTRAFEQRLKSFLSNFKFGRRGEWFYGTVNLVEH
jgi:hypothetical protein